MTEATGGPDAPATDAAAPVPFAITSPKDGDVLASNIVSVVGTAPDGNVVLYAGDQTVATGSASGGHFSLTASIADGSPVELWVGDGEHRSDAVNVTISGQPAPSGTAQTEPPTPVETTGSSIEAPSANPTTLPEQSTDTPDFPTSPVVADTAAPAGTPTPTEETAPSIEVPEQPQPAPAPPVTVAPPVIEQPGPAEALESGSVHFAGTADAGASVTVYLDGAALPVASTDDTGNWSFEQVIATGDHSAYATALVDSTVSGGSEVVSFTVSAAQETVPADETTPEDPEDALAKFLREKILMGYPIRWDIIFELRRKAEAWLATKNV